MITALSRSLPLRLLGIFIVTALLILIVLVVLFSRGMNSQWGRSIQPHLLQYVQYVQQDLGSPPDPERAKTLAQKLPVDIHIFKDDEFIYSTSEAVLDPDDYRFRLIPNIQRGEQRKVRNSSRTPTPPTQAKEPSSKQVNAAISYRGRDGGRILRINDNGYSVYYDLHRQLNRRGSFRRYGDELLLALLALGLILGTSYYLIRRQLKPIGQIQHNVGLMANGELQHRINRAGHSDLDELANSIDGMAARLQAMLDAKRQLLMAISHELRSPLTRARIATELLPESRNRERLEDDLNDMERMINDIMESEQLQTNHAILNLERLDIVALVKKELLLVSPSAVMLINGQTVNLQKPIDAETEIPIQGDAVRLRILLRNLVTNALEHGKDEDGNPYVEVHLSDTAPTLQLKVLDNGIGIEKDHISAVKEPFYRPDESRSRSTGGFGLGLTLANLIATAHGGSLDIESDPETKPGTRVTVTLPRLNEQESV